MEPGSRDNIRRFFHFLNGLLLIFIIQSYFTFRNSLPEKIPTHFKLDGTPDAWGGNVRLIEFLFIALGMSVMMYLFVIFIPRLAEKYPSSINIPNKEQFMNLPPDVKKNYYLFISEFMAALTVTLNLMWLGIMHSIADMVLEKELKMPWWGIWPALLLMAAVNIYYVYKMITLPKKLVSAYNQSGYNKYLI